MESTGSAPLQVLIADDHPLMIAGIRRTLERDDTIEVIGEAHSGAEVVSLVERRKPRLVLLDLRMPGMSGPECITSIKSVSPDVKIVVLSACDDQASINAALEAGANAYVVKSVNSLDIGALLRQAASGCVYHATSRPRLVTASAPESCGPALTNRERKILSAVTKGLTTATISRELWVSEHTVKFHLTNIYRKLGVTNRAGAVRYALEHELVAA